MTSEEIQRRYFTAKKAARSTVEIEGRYWLLKSEETGTSSEVYPDNGFCGKNNDNYRKNNTKESKVYYLSISESEQKESEFSIPAFDEVLTFAEEQQLDINTYKFYEYYRKHDWKTKKRRCDQRLEEYSLLLGAAGTKTKQEQKTVPESPIAEA